MKRRKRNWNAGMTREQHARGEIQIEHIRAFEDERARGAFGAPGVPNARASRGTEGGEETR
jgi:hypothetical protein